MQCVDVGEVPVMKAFISLRNKRVSIWIPGFRDPVDVGPDQLSYLGVVTDFLDLD